MSGGAFGPAGAFPYAGGIPDDLVAASLWLKQSLYFATHDLATEPDDTPPNLPIEGRLRLPTWRSELAIDEHGRYAGSAVIGFGEIALENPDNAIDELTGTTISDGGIVTISVAAVTTDAYGRRCVPALAEFLPLVSAMAEQWTLGDTIVNLALRDTTLRLDVPIQNSFYGGSGGLNGPIELAGRPLPICYGRCRNITPDLIDPTEQIYRFNDIPSLAVDAVYDRRVRLVADGDVLTYDELEDAVPNPGTYRTCLAESCFKLGAAPAGAVTADVRGGSRFTQTSFFDDGSNFDDGSGFAGYVADRYVDTTASIISRLLTDRTHAATDRIETTSFSRVDQVQPAEIGVYLPSTSVQMVRAVVNRLAGAIGASFGQGTDGRYELRRLESPPTDPAYSLEDEIIEINRVNLPYRIPAATWRIGYQVNWTLMTPADVADNAVEADRQFVVNRTTSYATRDDPEILNATIGRVGTVDAFYEKLEDAAAEGDRLLALYSLSRGLYEIDLPLVGLLYPRGTFIKVTYPQDPFRNGKSVVVVGSEINLPQGRVRLTVFG